MQIEKLTGAKFTQVPYPGGSKAAPALLGGEVDCYFASTSNFLRMQGARGLAIATKDRYELCPDGPTMNELGYKLESAKYRGLATPPDFPAEAQTYLEAALAKICANLNIRRAYAGPDCSPTLRNGKTLAKSSGRKRKRPTRPSRNRG